MHTGKREPSAWQPAHWQAWQVQPGSSRMMADQWAGQIAVSIMPIPITPTSQTAERR